MHRINIFSGWGTGSRLLCDFFHGHCVLWQKVSPVLWINCSILLGGNAPLLQRVSVCFLWWITPNGAILGIDCRKEFLVLHVPGSKISWFSESIITMSSVQSDMAANFWRAWWAWLIVLL